MITRQRVAHVIQPPPPPQVANCQFSRKTFLINENIQVDPSCFRFMAKISEIYKETHNRIFSLELKPQNILRYNDDYKL